MGEKNFGTEREVLIAQLCGHTFLRGFVFHSPKYYVPTEREAGDVVLWVRRQLIVFEIVARENAGSGNTKNFVKRIGQKRDQLIGDFGAFTCRDFAVEMKNGEGENVPLDKEDLADILQFSGVVIVDHEEELSPIHSESFEKSLKTTFPLNIMTKKSFLYILSEIDTVPDLWIYLQDRHSFLVKIFSSNPSLFLTLCSRVEEGLISFYRLHDNTFPVEDFKADAIHTYKPEYHTAKKLAMAARNQENKESLVVDNIIARIWNTKPWPKEGILPVWELASMTRRQRAGIRERLVEAFSRLEKEDEKQVFATGCWLVFYFRFGGSLEDFYKDTERFTELKLFQTMTDDRFSYSVFGYGFYKSSIYTGDAVDRMCCALKDAHQYDAIPESDLEEARERFGRYKTKKVSEFPDG